MRKFIVLVVCSFTLTQPAIAQEKPVKWEYAELMYRGSPGRPAGKDADGNPVEAVASTMSIRWTSKVGEFSVKGWDEMAEKLKIAFKKEGTAASQKLQMLNALGAEGWELASQHVGTAGASTTLTFKRRVP